jgi:hypothetical protein
VMIDGSVHFKNLKKRIINFLLTFGSPDKQMCLKKFRIVLIIIFLKMIPQFNFLTMYKRWCVPFYCVPPYKACQ